MSKLIRTSIALPEKLFKKVKEFNLSMSKISQEALEKRIKKEEANYQRKLSYKKIKKIYYKKGYETGRLSAKKYPKNNLKLSISTIKGEGRYSIWNIEDRIDDIFERNFDYKIFDDHFNQYEYGWVLKDPVLLKDTEAFWFTTNKPVDTAIEDYRAEALFEYKYGFTMGLCNMQESINPIEIDPILSRIDNSIIDSKFTKKQAIGIVNKEIDLILNNQNTIFSNPNSANDLWWFEPTYEKLESTFFLILNSSSNRILYIFKITPGKLKIKSFRDRPEKGRVSIIINSKDTYNFTDKNSGSANIKFSKYLIKTIKY